MATAAPALKQVAVELDSGESITLEEGHIDVPENRADENARTISIGFRRVPALAGTQGAPTFLLAGGPGSSYNQQLEDGGYLQEDKARLIRLFQPHGDVIIVDLRGGYLSTPHAECTGPRQKWRVIKTQAQFLDLWQASAAACREKLLDEGFDLDGYTVLEAAADVLAVADALGYDQLGLFGISFGSHWAITLARVAPTRISHMIISGVEGLDETVDDPIATTAALERIAGSARGAWNGAHGFDNPLQAATGLIETPPRERPVSRGLTPYELGTSLRGGLDYSLTKRRHMTDWPAEYAKLLKGAFFMTQARRLLISWNIGKGWGPAALGTFDCTSWISDARAERLRQGQQPFASDLATYEAYCRGWQITPLPAWFREPFQSPVRALFIHGNWDTATPIENAYAAFPNFPNASLTVVERGSHAAFHEALVADPQLAIAIGEWLEGGTAPPATITLPVPEFARATVGIPRERR
ncbi:MAG: alpha/beta fold hydrolase [Pseudomonadota bacterium]